MGMRRALLLLAVLLTTGCGSITGPSQSDLIGFWDGQITAGTASLSVSLVFVEREATGDLSGTWTSTPFGALGTVVSESFTNTTYDHPSLSFGSPFSGYLQNGQAVSVNCRVSGTVSDDVDQIDGTFSCDPRTFTFDGQEVTVGGSYGLSLGFRGRAP